MDLPEALRNQKKIFLQNVPSETAAIMGDAIEDLTNSSILSDCLKEGDHAPDFTLKDGNNNSIKLSDHLAKGPVILKFFRGDWWPYCNLELQALQQKFETIISTGAQLLAISPMLPQISVALVKKHGLKYSVLSDQGNKVAKKYGLVFKLAESLHPIYNTFGIDVPSTNGDNSHQLPLPATYIIDSDQIIRYCFVDVDHTVRLDPKIMLQEIANI